MRARTVAGVFAALILAAGCGSGSEGSGDFDASIPDDTDAGLPPNCGDGTPDPDEECDDGNDNEEDACLSNCKLACGDGRVSESEQCDTAIAAGTAGACPTDCDDSDACTTDALTGEACQTACEYGDVLATIDDDGCCPDGATSLDDNDCAVACGNGVRESGETCDTAITPGMAGACPTAADCVDGLVCTSDVLSDDGTCVAACGNPDITAPIDDDGCCPAGETIATDNDCTGTCGDGVVTSPETCDTAIAAGMAGACPTAGDCDDGMACTADNLVGGGTCNAACTNPAITAFVDGDGCCPAGGNNNLDDDCPVVCGNGATEMGETCDDGGVVPGDGCDASCQLEATAFRFTDMDLRDPHTFVDFIGCRDLTDTTFFGFSTNNELQTAIQTDDDGDGLLDLSPVVVFRPLDQAGTSTPMDFLFADCTAPMSSTTCSKPAGAMVTSSTATNMSSGTCLGVIPGTGSGYSPAIATASAAGGASCFASDAETITIDISGILITLQDARIAARYSGSPATGLVNGIVRGFISEADADATVLPDSLPIVGGQPLSSLLPGGSGNCASGDDRDVGPDGSTVGWYFYLNFAATARPYSE
jgi:cysteine-rich repeat protein